MPRSPRARPTASPLAIDPVEQRRKKRQGSQRRSAALFRDRARLGVGMRFDADQARAAEPREVRENPGVCENLEYDNDNDNDNDEDRYGNNGAEPFVEGFVQLTSKPVPNVSIAPPARRWHDSTSCCEITTRRLPDPIRGPGRVSSPCSESRNVVFRGRSLQICLGPRKKLHFCSCCRLKCRCASCGLSTLSAPYCNDE
jgi:hypothetical protein